MKPVTDPALISALDSEPASPPAPQAAQPSAVKDPATLAQLDYGLDLSKPDDEVRKGIAALPATEQ